MIDPRIFADVDGKYVGADGKVHESDRFTKRTIFSGWDVFRSQMPLQTIINPSLVNDLLWSLTTMAEESGNGYYERWEFLNAYSGCMLGNPAIAVLADAYAKDICQLNMDKAYAYADKTSKMFGNSALGYSLNPSSISKTLEYAYTEWCMSRLAEAMGKHEDAEYYAKLSQSYRNLYDTENIVSVREKPMAHSRLGLQREYYRRVMVVRNVMSINRGGLSLMTYRVWWN